MMNFLRHPRVKQEPTKNCYFNSNTKNKHWIQKIAKNILIKNKKI